MALWQGRSKRKPTGGRIKFSRNKRKFEIGREKQWTIIGERKVKHSKTLGYKNKKVRVMQAEFANVLDPKKKSVKKVKVDSVVENPSNPHFVQRNIITKGATIKTELGLAKVTSRPGQHGVVNATLIQK